MQARVQSSAVDPPQALLNGNGTLNVSDKVASRDAPASKTIVASELPPDGDSDKPNGRQLEEAMAIVRTAKKSEKDRKKQKKEKKSKREKGKPTFSVVDNTQSELDHQSSKTI